MDIKELEDALMHSPDNVPLRLLYANALLKSSDYPSAEEQFNEVLRLEKSNAQARFGLARCAFSQQVYSKCIVILEDLTEENPAKEYLLLLCRALLKDNSIEAAREQYEHLLGLFPSTRDTELDGIFRRPGQAGQAADDADEFDEDAMEQIERPAIGFADVGGLDQVKAEIDLKIIKPLQHQDLYAAYGKKIGGGILLYGPPGCGKTHLARATAGQIDAAFISIGINDVLDMWIGNSEKNLHEIFQAARNNAPCVLFFDEVDALGASRTDMRQSAGRQLINQFLAEMDGADHSNDGVLILGATNAPWHLDPAFRRPGRFDRIIFVTPPDLEARKAILDLLIEGKPTDKLDTLTVAKKCADFSGADLSAVVDITIEAKLSESFSSGIPQPIGTKDLLAAKAKVKPSTKEWFSTARNYALYSNEGGIYDDILTYLKIKK